LDVLFPEKAAGLQLAKKDFANRYSLHVQIHVTTHSSSDTLAVLDGMNMLHRKM
jgi:hypothetical protein